MGECVTTVTSGDGVACATGGQFPVFSLFVLRLFVLTTDTSCGLCYRLVPGCQCDPAKCSWKCFCPDLSNNCNRDWPQMPSCTCRTNMSWWFRWRWCVVNCSNPNTLLTVASNIFLCVADLCSDGANGLPCNVAANAPSAICNSIATGGKCYAGGILKAFIMYSALQNGGGQQLTSTNFEFAICRCMCRLWSVLQWQGFYKWSLCRSKSCRSSLCRQRYE